MKHPYRRDGLTLSRLKELNERLQIRNRESPARVDVPPNWREQPIRSVVIVPFCQMTQHNLSAT